MFTHLKNKHIEQIYNLQVNNVMSLETIFGYIEINDLIKKTVFFSSIFHEQKRLSFGISLKWKFS